MIRIALGKFLLILKIVVRCNHHFRITLFSNLGKILCILLNFVRIINSSVERELLKGLKHDLFPSSLRSEPWEYVCRGEQGKQPAWEPVGHSTLTDWNKYCGTVEFICAIVCLLTSKYRSWFIAPNAACLITLYTL